MSAQNLMVIHPMLLRHFPLNRQPHGGTREKVRESLGDHYDSLIWKPWMLVNFKSSDLVESEIFNY